MGHEETADAAVGRFDFQAVARAEVHAMGIVVDPDIQMVLLAAHTLPRKLDDHAQQAVVFVMALGIAELHELQRPRTGGTVRGQWGQAQHLEMLGLNVCPRQRRHVDGRVFFSRGVGGRFGCCFVVVMRRDPVQALRADSLLTADCGLIGRFSQDWRPIAA